jgi:hypothetical protein
MSDEEIELTLNEIQHKLDMLQEAISARDPNHKAFRYIDLSKASVITTYNFGDIKPKKPEPRKRPFLKLVSDESSDK